MSWAMARRPWVAFAAAALIGAVWLNQGPSARRYDALAAEHGGVALRAWLPFAFLYRRAVDEELYYATANAIRGAPFDRAMLEARRGATTPAFRRLPPADGRWHAPYDDVPFEYPALILPFVLGPAIVSPSFDVFAVVSGALMAALLLASIALGARSRGATGDGERAACWWTGSALLLAQGGVAIQRVDAVPAFFLAIALWAAAARRPFAMGVGVGLAAAAKVTPLLALLPMMAADRGAWRGTAPLGKLAAGLALALAAGLLPMAVAWPHGFASFLEYHRARGLQVESTYGVVAAVASLVTGNARAAALSFGSYNLDGEAARRWAAAAMPVSVAAVALFAAWVARRPSPATPAARAEAIAYAGLGGLLCVWLFGKVFSPQYMTWAIPFAVAVPARRVGATLVAAMAVAQLYLRGFYDHVVEMRPDGVAALAARLAALCVLAAIVLSATSPARREPSLAESPP